MNKDTVIELLNELKMHINYDDMDSFTNKEKIEYIKKTEDQSSEVLRKIVDIENNISNDEYYNNYINEYKNRYQTIYDNTSVSLSKVQDEIARSNENIDILSKEIKKLEESAAKYNDQIDNLEKSSLKNNENAANIQSQVDLLKTKLNGINSSLKLNNSALEYYNNELESNNNNLSKINENIKNQEELLKNFDNVLSDEYINNKKNEDKEELEKNKKIYNDLKQYQSFLENSFNDNIDNMIQGLRDDSISVNQVLINIDIFKKKILNSYLDQNKISNDDELKNNIEQQEKCNKLISELETKISDNKNYFYSETTKNNQRMNFAKIERIIVQNKMLSDKSYKKDYSEITKLYEKDNEALYEALNKPGITNEEKIDLEKRIADNNITISQGKDLVNYCGKYQNLYDKMHERIYGLNQVDEASLELDRKQLYKYKMQLECLKNRQAFLQTNVEDILNKFEVPELEKDKKIVQEVPDKTPERLEIIFVKRPLKERIKEKISKVKKAISLSMSIILATVPASSIINSINQNDTIESSIEELQNDNSLDDKEKEELNKEIEEIKKEELNISMNDKVKINENADIYNNQIDAINKTNPFESFNSKDNERNIIGVSIKMPDGSFKFVQDDNSINKFVNEGGEVGALLTGENDLPEGFWNINDVVKVQALTQNQEIGGMTR